MNMRLYISPLVLNLLISTHIAFAADLVKPTPVPRTPAAAITPGNGNVKRHQIFMNRIKDGPVGLLFIGDSITDFWPKTGEFSWLKFAAYNPADFGVSGETTEQVLWRLTNGELSGIKPKVAVIMIGTNNIGRFADEKPEWAAAGVAKIVELVRQKLPATKILLLAVFPRNTKDSPQRAKVNEINKIISKLGNSTTVRYLDIGKEFLNGSGELTPDIMPDMLHPSAKGYEIWYAAMMPPLAEMMK